jgi:hypothetical protein
MRAANTRKHTHMSRKIRPLNKDMYTSPSHFEYLIDGYYFVIYLTTLSVTPINGNMTSK